MRSLHLMALCGIPLALAGSGCGGCCGSCPPPPPRFKADIRADTNRDGRVDLQRLSDTIDKTRWNETHGAIFLPNIGDTGKRCRTEYLHRNTFSDERLDDCHDASDNTQRSPEYLAPLKTVPNPDLFGSAKGTVTVPDATQRKFAGLDLGIDARDTRRPESRDTRNPESWDGNVTVRFTIQAGGTKSSDTVMLRVAPVLTHHHLQKVEQVLASGEDWDPTLVNFTNALVSITKAAGLKKDLYLFKEPSDRWVQDFVEPGYASMPGPNGTVSIRIMIRCPGDERQGGRQLFLDFRKAGVGAVQHLGARGTDIDAGGNIEAIPPYTFKGKTWPAGRLIVGKHGNKSHHLLSYLEAQESQKPVRLDTDWLAVGHVDEFVQFIPANNTRGWVAVISDPRLALEILNDQQKAGHGSVLAISRKDHGFYVIPTITQLLWMADVKNLNEWAAQKIDRNIKILKDEVGLTDEDIVRIPALFSETKRSELGLSKREVRASYPAVINNLVLTGYNTCVAPSPWGPVIDGKDVFVEEIRNTYARVGMKIRFMDVWESHHEGNGAVHCGTNSIRDMSDEWW
ncbi:arginine deiminase type-3 [Fusarium mexicanum]|uniref:Arginine deiminase type-3 n=1 Tax=Fusarium mexicanum TaxID=751941 RepID=A0A8H5JC01_9HYPO|nr:arginine deiminase type-3 [Fusarium mexicanum]